MKDYTTGTGTNPSLFSDLEVEIVEPALPYFGRCRSVLGVPDLGSVSKPVEIDDVTKSLFTLVLIRCANNNNNNKGSTLTIFTRVLRSKVL